MAWLCHGGGVRSDGTSGKRPDLASCVTTAEAAQHQLALLDNHDVIGDDKQLVARCRRVDLLLAHTVMHVRPTRLQIARVGGAATHGRRCGVDARWTVRGSR